LFLKKRRKRLSRNLLPPACICAVPSHKQLSGRRKVPNGPIVSTAQQNCSTRRSAQHQHHPKSKHPLRKGIIERNMVSSRTPTAIMMAALRAGAALSLIDVQHSSAFAPAPSHSQRTVHCDRHRGRAASVPTALCLSSSDIQAKLRAQMAKLQERDRSSREISPDVSVDEQSWMLLDCDIALSAPHRRPSADPSLPARSSFFAHRELLIVPRNWTSYMKTNTLPS